MFRSWTKRCNPHINRTLKRPRDYTIPRETDGSNLRNLRLSNPLGKITIKQQTIKRFPKITSNRSFSKDVFSEALQSQTTIIRFKEVVKEVIKLGIQKNIQSLWPISIGDRFYKRWRNRSILLGDRIRLIQWLKVWLRTSRWWEWRREPSISKVRI